MSRKLVALAAISLLTLIITTCSDDGTSPPAGGGNDVPDTVAAPAFSPAPGTHYTSVEVTMSCATADAVVYYTTDGTDPDETSTEYSPGTGIDIGTSTTFRARAYKTDIIPSEVAVGAYTIDIVDVALPKFSPPGGIYSTGQRVFITCSTASSIVYYTNDGSDPTQASTVVPAGGLAVNANTTLRARAYVNRVHQSSIGQGIYTFIPGLVAQYKLDGNTLDSSGNGHDARSYGPLMTYDHAGAPRAAYLFDGVDDYMALPDESAFDMTGFTIMGWFHYDTLPPVVSGTTQRRYALVNKGTNFGNFSVFLNKIGGASYCNVQLTFQTAGGNYTMICQDRNIYRNEWVHIAVTYDREIKIYVNGQLECTSPTTVDPPSMNNDAVWLGRYRSTTDEWFFDGSLDEIRFYNRSLNASEINTLYFFD